MTKALAGIALLAVLLAGRMGAAAETGEWNFGTVAAPPMETIRTLQTRKIGVVDDVYGGGGLGYVLVRQGNDLFAVMGGDLKKLVTVPEAAKSKMVSGMRSGDRDWLLLEVPEGPPLVLDLKSGKRVELPLGGMGEVPNPKALPGVHGALLPGAKGALVTLASSDKAWPRDGNRSLYYWMNLENGKVAALPVGWDLSYLSADMKVAVFEKPATAPGKARLLQALAMATGETLPETPNKQLTPWIDSPWCNSPVKPVLGTYKGYLVGFSAGGVLYPLEVNIKGDEFHVETAKGDGTQVAWLGRNGAELKQTFWTAPLKDPKRTQQINVAAGITDFAMLGEGKCLLAVKVAQKKNPAADAFTTSPWVYSLEDGHPWRVLEGEGLPPLAPEFAEKGYIRDTMSMRMIETLGGGGPVLCLFEHMQGDMRANPEPPKAQVWRRAVVVTSGHRYMTDLYRDVGAGDLLWLDNTGTLITVDKTYPKPGGPAVLNLVTIKLEWDRAAGPAVKPDSDRAVALATAAARKEGMRMEDFAMQDVQQITHQGKTLWRVTYKLSVLMGDNPNRPMITGGEIFVNVDLTTQETKVMYGE